MLMFSMLKGYRKLYMHGSVLATWKLFFFFFFPAIVMNDLNFQQNPIQSSQFDNQYNDEEYTEVLLINRKANVHVVN